MAEKLIEALFGNQDPDYKKGIAGYDVNSVLQARENAKNSTDTLYQTIGNATETTEQKAQRIINERAAAKAQSTADMQSGKTTYNNYLKADTNLITNNNDTVKEFSTTETPSLLGTTNNSLDKTTSSSLVNAPQVFASTDDYEEYIKEQNKKPSTGGTILRNLASGTLAGVDAMTHPVQSLEVMYDTLKLTKAERDAADKSPEFQKIITYMQENNTPLYNGLTLEQWKNNLLNTMETGQKNAEYWNEEGKLDSQELADKSLFGEGVKEFQQKAAEDTEKLGSVGKFFAEMANSAGFMLPSMVVGGAVAGAAGKALGIAGLTADEIAAAGLGGAVNTAQNLGKAAGLATMFENVYSNTVKQYTNQGYNWDDVSKKAFMDAALEVSTELLGGGIPGLGSGAADDVLERTIGGLTNRVGNSLIAKTSNGVAGSIIARTAAGVGKFLASDTAGKYIADCFGEGVEEVISEIVSPYIDRLTIDPNASNATLGEILRAGLSGAMLSGILNAGTTAASYAEENGINLTSIFDKDGKVSTRVLPRDASVSADPAEVAVNQVNSLLRFGVGDKTLLGEGMEYEFANGLPAQFQPAPMEYIAGVTTVQDVQDYVKNTALPAVEQATNYLTNKANSKEFNNKIYSIAPKIEITDDMIDGEISAKDLKELNSIRVNGTAEEFQDTCIKYNVNPIALYEAVVESGDTYFYGDNMYKYYESALANHDTEINPVIRLSDTNGNVRSYTLNQFVNDVMHLNIDTLNTAQKMAVMKEFESVRSYEQEKVNKLIGSTNEVFNKIGMTVEAMTEKEVNAPGSEGVIGVIDETGNRISLNPEYVGTYEGVTYTIAHEVGHRAQINGLGPALHENITKMSEVVGMNYNELRESVAASYPNLSQEELNNETDNMFLSLFLADKSRMKALAMVDGGTVDGIDILLDKEMQALANNSEYVKGLREVRNELQNALDGAAVVEEVQDAAGEKLSNAQAVNADSVKEAEEKAIQIPSNKGKGKGGRKPKAKATTVTEEVFAPKETATTVDDLEAKARAFAEDNGLEFKKRDNGSISVTEYTNPYDKINYSCIEITKDGVVLTEKDNPSVDDALTKRFNKYVENNSSKKSSGKKATESKKPAKKATPIPAKADIDTAKIAEEYKKRIYNNLPNTQIPKYYAGTPGFLNNQNATSSEINSAINALNKAIAKKDKKAYKSACEKYGIKPSEIFNALKSMSDVYQDSTNAPAGLAAYENEDYANAIAALPKGYKGTDLKSIYGADIFELNDTLAKKARDSFLATPQSEDNTSAPPVQEVKRWFHTKNPDFPNTRAGRANGKIYIKDVETNKIIDILDDTKANWATYTKAKPVETAVEETPIPAKETKSTEVKLEKTIPEKYIGARNAVDDFYKAVESTSNSKVKHLADSLGNLVGGRIKDILSKLDEKYGYKNYLVLPQGAERNLINAIKLIKDADHNTKLAESINALKPKVEASFETKALENLNAALLEKQIDKREYNKAVKDIKKAIESKDQTSLDSFCQTYGIDQASIMNSITQELIDSGVEPEAAQSFISPFETLTESQKIKNEFIDSIVTNIYSPGLAGDIYIKQGSTKDIYIQPKKGDNASPFYGLSENTKSSAFKQISKALDSLIPSLDSLDSVYGKALDTAEAELNRSVINTNDGEFNSSVFNTKEYTVDRNSPEYLKNMQRVKTAIDFERLVPIDETIRSIKEKLENGVGKESENDNTDIYKADKLPEAFEKKAKWLTPEKKELKGKYTYAIEGGFTSIDGGSIWKPGSKIWIRELMPDTIRNGEIVKRFRIIGFMEGNPTNYKRLNSSIVDPSKAVVTLSKTYTITPNAVSATNVNTNEAIKILARAGLQVEYNYDRNRVELVKPEGMKGDLSQEVRNTLRNLGFHAEQIYVEQKFNVTETNGSQYEDSRTEAVSTGRWYTNNGNENPEGVFQTMTGLDPNSEEVMEGVSKKIIKSREKALEKKSEEMRIARLNKTAVNNPWGMSNLRMINYFDGQNRYYLIENKGGGGIPGEYAQFLGSAGFHSSAEFGRKFAEAFGTSSEWSDGRAKKKYGLKVTSNNSTLANELFESANEKIFEISDAALKRLQLRWYNLMDSSIGKMTYVPEGEYNIDRIEVRLYGLNLNVTVTDDTYLTEPTHAETIKSILDGTNLDFSKESIQALLDNESLNLSKEKIALLKALLKDGNLAQPSPADTTGKTPYKFTTNFLKEMGFHWDRQLHSWVKERPTHEDWKTLATSQRNLGNASFSELAENAYNTADVPEVPYAENSYVLNNKGRALRTTQKKGIESYDDIIDYESEEYYDSPFTGFGSIEEVEDFLNEFGNKLTRAEKDELINKAKAIKAEMNDAVTGGVDTTAEVLRNDNLSPKLREKATEWSNIRAAGRRRWLNAKELRAVENQNLAARADALNEKWNASKPHGVDSYKMTPEELAAWNAKNKYKYSTSATADRINKRASILETIGIGKQNAEALNNLWESLKQRNGTQEKGEAPKSIDTDFSKSRTKLSKSIDSLLADRSVPESSRNITKQVALAGYASNEVFTNQQAKDYAMNSLRNEFKEIEAGGHINAPQLATATESFINTLRFNVLQSAEDNAKLSALRQAWNEYAAQLEAEGKELTDSEAAMIAMLNVEVAQASTYYSRGLQSMRVIYQSSPFGREYFALRTVERYIEELKAQTGSKRYGQVLQTANAIDGYIQTQEFKQLLSHLKKASTQAEIDAAETAIAASIAQFVPTTIEGRTTAFRYLCMLGNPRTHIRNLASNAIMRAAVNIKNGLKGVVEDKFLGEDAIRTRSAANKASEELIEFAQNDSLDMKKLLMSGGKQRSFASQVQQLARKFGDNSIGRFFEKLSAVNGDALEAEDWIFIQKTYVDSLANYLAANKLTVEDIKGTDKVSIEKLSAARDYAVEESLKATYRNANEVANFLSKWERRSPVARILIGGLIPFKTTPFNVLKQGAKYSPIGIINGVIKAFTQVGKTGTNGHLVTVNEAIDDICSGLTGTGAAVLGYFLASLGMAKGSGTDNDREEYYDQMLGFQPYSIKLGDYGTYTVDWATPSSMPFFMGVELYEALSGEADSDTLTSAVLSALSSVADPLTSLSFLSGVNDALNSYSDKKLQAVAATTVANYATQYVPTLGGQIARALDGTRRTTYAPKDSDNIFGQAGEQVLNKIKNKIPGLASTNEPYVDMWGRTEENAGGLLYQTLSPGYLKKMNVTEVDDELTEIFEKTQNTSVLPTTPKSSQTIDGTTYYLQPKEYTEYKTTAGSIKLESLNSVFDSQLWGGLDSDAQASVIANVYSYADTVAKKEYANSKKLEYETSDTKEIDYVKAAEETGISVGDYFIIREVLNSFDAKDANGKSVTGLKSKRQKAYAASLGLSQKQFNILLHRDSND